MSEVVLTQANVGYVRSYLVIPTAVYGIAHGPIFEAGLAHPHSMLSR